MAQVLVTRAMGFIGKYLVRSLLSDKETSLIVNDVLNDPTGLNLFNEMPLSFHELDIRNRNSLFDLFKHERIRHMHPSCRKSKC